MKTKTNFQKAAIRSGAVVVSFVLISFTVSAQGFWKKLLTNSSFNEIAIAMVETAEVKGTSPKLSTSSTEWKSFDLAFDPALELEGWMSDENYFRASGIQSLKEVEENVENNSTGILDFRQDEIELLSLESWMVDEVLWVN